MSHSYNGLRGCFALASALPQSGIKLAHSFGIRIALGSYYRIVALTKKRNRHAKHLCCALAIGQLYDQIVVINLSILLAHHPFNPGALLLQQRQRCFEPCCRVVISGYNDQLQSRVFGGYLLYKSVEEALRSGRRVRHIKHISGNEQRVNFVRLNGLRQPSQKVLMLRCAIKTEEGLPQVPVGRMDYAYHYFMLYIYPHKNSTNY